MIVLYAVRVFVLSLFVCGVLFDFAELCCGAAT